MTSHDQRGVFLMVGASASIVVNDALCKIATQSVPVSQLVFVQGVFTTVLFVAVAIARRVPLSIDFLTHRSVLLRSVLGAGSLVAFVFSLKNLSLVVVTAIAMVTPIFSALLFMAMFRERVGAGRWFATAAGFGGVLLIVRPGGQEFNMWTLLMLLTSFLAASRDVITRSVPKSIPSLVLPLANVIAMVPCALAIGIAEEWHWLSLTQFSVLGAASLFLSASFFLVALAMREGNVAVIAPFRYSNLLFAAAIGYAIWGDIPDRVAFAGMTLIVVAGLCLVRAR
jgi:drug/metabolite transporter (DMT)-like permease